VNLKDRIELCRRWIRVAAETRSPVSHGVATGVILAFREDGSLDTGTYKALQTELNNAIMMAYPNIKQEGFDCV
jgi:hypothetical protein